MIKTVGIIGYGAFGQFIHSKLPDNLDVKIYVRSPRPEVKTISSLEEVSKCDLLFLSIPLESYAATFEQIKDLIADDTVLIDVCSVKVIPQKIIDQYFPSHKNMLITHPLFGPQSASESTKGHKMIITNKIGKKADLVLEFCEQSLELDITHMTAEQHDKEMAQVHALTFFVSRGLGNMNLAKSNFKTPSYSMIEKFVEFNDSHTDDLFKTIELGNPFAREIRDKFIAEFDKLNEELDSQKLIGE